MDLSGCSKCITCGRYAAFTAGPSRITPLSGRSLPVSIFSSVVFPVPFSPSRAMRSPPSHRRYTSSNSRFSPKALLTPLICNTSSPLNSRLWKRASSFRAFVGFAVVRIRSMRFSMLKARLCSASLPMKAHRCICSAAFSSCAIFACSFRYCFMRS